MEQTPKKNSVATVLAFFFLLIFIGGISLVLIKQNTDINGCLSTLSAAQSRFMDSLAVLSSDVNSLHSSLEEPTTIPVHTIIIREPTTTPPETTTEATTTVPETTTIPETTVPETVPVITEPVQEYISIWLGTAEYRIPVIPTIPKHDYNWENLVTLENGIKYYTENGKKVSYEGIDVSSHQKDIDWEKIKATGIDFAMIRVGFRGYGTAGTVTSDMYFKQNIEGALAAGLKVGVYFFSQALNEEEAIEEANFVLEQIKDYDITYPVVYDAEDIADPTARTTGLLGEQITNNCIAFCERIKEAGYTPMIYANKRWFLTRLDLTRLTSYDLWHAAYVDAPDTPYLYTMWQYSNSGKFDGINGPVDLNISFIDYSNK